ncbi:MAG: TIGR04255 family protein [candidate division Zixibacteria bacterium]|nr:TIGR04255 family protein [candidate division Zixibacteria bacterium]
MRTQAAVEIKVNEQFDHLPGAPIVEAVIDVRADTIDAFEEPHVRSQLEDKLDGYEFLDSQRAFRHEVKLEAGKPSQAVSDLGWKGLRFQSTDRKHIVQFNRDGFVFSRLEPYQSWKRFYDEGLCLWRTYIKLAQPVEIYRLGLRYINRLQLNPGEVHFEDYLQPAAMPPRNMDLPFLGFMHYDTLAVPGHPYAINVVRTIQRPADNSLTGIGVILDIDVFTTHSIEFNETLLPERLQEMRWLKNKVFFGSVTEKALESLR